MSACFMIALSLSLQSLIADSVQQTLPHTDSDDDDDVDEEENDDDE